MRKFGIIFGLTCLLNVTQAFASASATISGTIVNDCTITSGSVVQSATQITAILRNPAAAAQTIQIPFTAQCSSYQPPISIQATNGNFKSSTVSPVNTVTIPYSVTAASSTGYVSSGVNVTGASIKAAPLAFGYLNLTSAVTFTLAIQPGAVAALPADTYSETITVSVNGQ